MSKTGLVSIEKMKDLVKYNDLCHLLSRRGMREGLDYHSRDFSDEERSACIVWFSRFYYSFFWGVVEFEQCFVIPHKS